jgi:hypothetical protein
VPDYTYEGFAVECTKEGETSVTNTDLGQPVSATNGKDVWLWENSGKTTAHLKFT